MIDLIALMCELQSPVNDTRGKTAFKIMKLLRKNNPSALLVCLH